MKSLAINASRFTLIAAVTVAYGSPATADVRPNIGDMLQQKQPSLPDHERKPAPVISDREQPPGPPMKHLPAGPKVEVKRFEFSGNRHVSSTQLNALIGHEAGKPLSLAELEALALRVTRFYRTHGYFVARAYIPAQDVRDGAIEIRVIEGQYGKFVLENKSRVRDDVLQGILDDAKRRDVISVDSLERAILTINDMPGASVARADVVPGEAVGTSDVVVSTNATPPARGYLLLDNHGSIYTGRHRLSFNADLLSPTGRGDRLSFGGLAGNNADLVNGRVAYSTQLSPSGLRGELSVGRTQYTLADKYEALGATGAATGIEATLTYPLTRTSVRTVEGALTGAHRRLEDSYGVEGDVRSRKSISSLTAGISMTDERSLFGFRGMTQASGAISIGKLVFGDAQDLANDADGESANGDFAKFSASLERLSFLPNQFTLTASARLQHVLNGKNLHGSEKLSVSGAGGVMAYPAHELSGTNAAFLRLELSRPLMRTSEFSSKWQVFHDWGHASAARPLPGNAHSRTISDVGVGLSADYQRLRMRVQAARRLQDGGLSEPSARTRILAQLGLVF